MKLNLLKKLSKVVLWVAIFSAATPSQFTCFQPQCPEKLKKYQ